MSNEVTIVGPMPTTKYYTFGYPRNHDPDEYTDESCLFEVLACLRNDGQLEPERFEQIAKALLEAYHENDLPDVVMLERQDIPDMVDVEWKDIEP